MGDQLLGIRGYVGQRTEGLDDWKGSMETLWALTRNIGW